MATREATKEFNHFLVYFDDQSKLVVNRSRIHAEGRIKVGFKYPVQWGSKKANTDDAKILETGEWLTLSKLIKDAGKNIQNISKPKSQKSTKPPPAKKRKTKESDETGYTANVILRIPAPSVCTNKSTGLTDDESDNSGIGESCLGDSGEGFRETVQDLGLGNSGSRKGVGEGQTLGLGSGGSGEGQTLGLGSGGSGEGQTLGLGSGGSGEGVKESQTLGLGSGGSGEGQTLGLGSGGSGEGVKEGQTLGIGSSGSQGSGLPVGGLGEAGRDWGLGDGDSGVVVGGSGMGVQNPGPAGSNFGMLDQGLGNVSFGPLEQGQVLGDPGTPGDWIGSFLDRMGDRLGDVDGQRTLLDLSSGRVVSDSPRTNTDRRLNSSFNVSTPLKERKLNQISQKIDVLNKRQLALEQSHRSIELANIRIENKLDMLLNKLNERTLPSTCTPDVTSVTNPVMPIVSDSEFSNIPGQFRLDYSELVRIKTSSNGPGNFAKNVVERLFSELFTEENKRLGYSYNGGGNLNKLELDPERKMYVQQYVLHFHPEVKATEAWKGIVIPKINEALRRPSERKKKN